MNRSMKFKRTVDTNPFSLAARGKFDKQSISSLSLSLLGEERGGGKNEGGKSGEERGDKFARKTEEKW